MQVRAWMSQPVIVAGEEDPVHRLAQTMEAAEIHHMPVVGETGEVIGIVSSRDLALPQWLRTVPPFVNATELPRSLKARDVLSPLVLTVEPEDHIGYVAELLIDARVSAVPVVDQDGQVHGILSLSDVMRALLVHLPHERRG